MRLWNKVRSLFGRGIEADLAEEIRLHRVMLEDRFRGEGLSAREARERAAREFGPAASALEDSRAQWSFVWLESVWSDAAYAVRALRRSKTFAATAVLTLGVGLALTSVAFTLFNAYVLRPFAVRDPGSLYEVNWTGINQSANRYLWHEYEAIRERRDVFSDIIGTRSVSVSGETRHWGGVLVTGNYFRMLGARIAIGRPIEERDARTPGGDTVVVISHAAWKSAFNMDPAVLGRKIVLRGLPYEVIGVAGEEFTGLEDLPPDFWVPISMHSAFKKAEMSLAVVGRLGEGVNEEQAEAALGALARLHHPELRAKLTPRSSVVPFSPVMIVFFSPVLLALGLVLATCCANVANIILARGMARQREIGVRIAVGAGRVRLVRQLLTEALVIASLAGLLGIALARLVLDGGQRIFYATIAPEFAEVVRLHSLEIDYRGFAFALAVAGLAAVGSALLPALQSTRMSMVAALRGEFGAGIRSSRLRDGLVVAQVVVCVVLLVCGALLYRRAAVFQAQDTGMRTSGVVDVNLPERRAEVAEFLRASPDIENVAVASRAPWYGRLERTEVTPSGHVGPSMASFNFVSPGYFDVFRIPLKSGRMFTEAEARSSAPVAVISAATAQAFWPGENPVGKTIRPDQGKEQSLEKLTGHTQVQVIGVVADALQGLIFEGKDKTCLYLPVAPSNEKAGNLLISVRGDEVRGLEKLRRQLAERWPTLETQLFPMSAVIGLQIYPFRAAAWIGWMLGLVAMALSISGMYGVMSYLVNQRSKEIGIRVALGATRARVVALVLRRSLALTAIGVVTGAALAGAAVKLLLWLSGSLSLLVWDNTALFAGGGVAGIAAVLAALGPSSRAARIDPNQVLRAD